MGTWIGKRRPVAGGTASVAFFAAATWGAAAIASGGAAGGPPSAPPSPGSPRASVRIARPAASEVVYGPAVLRAEVVPPAGARVLFVDLFADGALAGRDAAAPYEARWDAGRSLGSHVLRAVARFSDGTSAEDLITTRGLDLRHHEVVEGAPIERVELLVSVTDEEGGPVTGLTASDFEVREGGAPVVVKGFEVLGGRAEVPLSVAILVDRSGSMRFAMKKWREAALALLASLRPRDQIRVSAFSDEHVVLQDFTRDAASLAASLDAIGPAGGGTRLFRAIFESVRDMRDLPGRKALIVLTDGADTDYTSPSSPVFAGMYAVLAETARMASRAGVTVIVVLPGPTGRGYLAVQDLALQTGGWWTYPSEDLRALMRRLGERLLSAYVIEYDADRPADPDRKRPVKVTLRPGLGERLEVRAALGTYARLDALDALRGDLAAGNDAQRARAARELGRLDAPDVPELLLRALKDGSPEVRAEAVGALAERREPAALAKVLRRIHDADLRVREAAFEAAVRYGADSIPALEEASRSRSPARIPALQALGRIGDPRALPAIEAALAEKDCAVRAAAAEAAGSAALLIAGPAGAGEDPASAPAPAGGARRLLRAALADPCAEASGSAAVGLGRLGDRSALPRLLEIVSAEEPGPRLPEAILALASFPEPPALAAVERHLRAEGPAREAARRAAASAYRGAAVTGRPIPREEAVERLVALGGEEALMVLRDLEAAGAAGGADPGWRARIEEAIRRAGGA
jgi:VWFA-related protein